MQFAGHATEEAPFGQLLAQHQVDLVVLGQRQLADHRCAVCSASIVLAIGQSAARGGAADGSPAPRRRADALLHRRRRGAVHRQHGAGDVARARRRQEQHRIGDLARLGQAAERLARLGAGQRLLGADPQQPGFGEQAFLQAILASREQGRCSTSSPA